MLTITQPEVELNTMELVAKIHGLVDLWVANGGVEEYTIETDRAKTPSELIAELKLFFQSVIRSLDKIQRLDPILEEPYNLFLSVTKYTACMLTYATFFSELFTASDHHPSKGSSDYEFLVKLWRRLSRLSCYSVGVAMFADSGIPLIKKALRPSDSENFLRGDSNLSIEWIELGDYLSTMSYTHGKMYAWPSSPSDRLEALLTKYGQDLSLTPSMREALLADPKLARAWKKGSIVTPRLHPEMMMTIFLAGENILVQKYAIGVSKPTCWCCRIFTSLEEWPWRSSDISQKHNHT